MQSITAFPTGNIIWVNFWSADDQAQVWLPRSTATGLRRGWRGRRWRGEAACELLGRHIERLRKR